ncbi:phosphatidylglycerophosphatase A family protein [Acinetobacter qingfengensis]|uniref:phosphatidylglycerophosphatase A family protein n=1 Tax=Acinetobacter qingfengensis TaxID=1262585 RepID=UPI000AD9E15F|nr:phosphatidylglycerophosphatase A [Acinetobacter qingfengensis]
MPQPPIDLSRHSGFDKFIWFLGVGLGSGLLSKAPGTMGSLAILVLYPLWIVLGLFSSIVIIILMSIVGIYICGRSAEIMQVHDDGRIVWDEFAGQSITLLPLIYFAQSSWWLWLGFALFRLFDIWKPFPIGWADRHISGGLGIMLDDLLAGIMAACVFGAILFFVS